MTQMQSPAWQVLAPRNSNMGPEREPEHSTDHWRLTRDSDDIAWLILDRKGESANSLSADVMSELNDLLDVIEKGQFKGLVIRSAKKSGFIAGADIRDFTDETEAEVVAARMTQAHGIIDRLEALPIPTLALVHGHCLGGGLELALACDQRLAIEGASFGFPEVMLGLHPGLGGTFRSLELINPISAMTLMLTGRPANARKAKKMGLVDAVVEERHVGKAVKALLAKKVRRQPDLMSRLWRLGFMRQISANKMRSQTGKKARKEHYPAPYALIDLWEKHGVNRKALQKAEIKSFAQQLVGSTAQNLVHVFFLRERLKSFGKAPCEIRHVHVVGAGTMGADIAAWAASRGMRVTLTDLEPDVIAKAIGRAGSFYGKKLRARADQRDALDRLIPDLDGAGVGQADLIIEAVAEKVEIKSKVYEALEARMKPGAILATNTSSIPLETLAEKLKHPERFVGLHFFNPVTRMELVEVVSHDKVSEDTLESARGFCGAIARLPVPVKSAPGFLVNRALTPYLVEAFVLLDEGHDKATIDKAAEDFGMPMGPIELADRVGLDIGLSVAKMLKERLDDPMPEVPEWLQKKVDDGDLGQKTEQGLYRWVNGKADKGEPVKPPAELIDRLVLPMLNTCVRCLREGVIEDADALDGAMIFGTGFAPFRGGPLHYARQRGVDDVVETLKSLEALHGERFAPDAGWDALKK
ncbi:3-hydroxyacyl-CoA dehydrogenase NAD-binding domain-containing protein [Marinimicrobium alkaliphilum]|uniref:3-hydroxyacyl-CoA dehydrogenase NAD-binding domain-containing protein n=1 Tax=Marinimicrobium alkaliphilum TaxID=2202654 RepID=UPI000DB979F0|nr:3-hydroxyacyl-CoA dehydrogenase NAD-binding domain-containing protein [Marinimicrobium alkaliphilum]